jgi:hypothetical protein
VGKRSRRRQAAGRDPAPGLGPAPEDAYPDDEGNVLVLRGVLSPATRAEYAALGAGAVREDAWHRRVEFLFERLAVRWELSGLPLEGQKPLLARFRAASAEERATVREALRAHLAEHFPELEAP